MRRIARASMLRMPELLVFQGIIARNLDFQGIIIIRFCQTANFILFFSLHFLLFFTMNCLVLISLVFLLFYRVECNSLLEASTNKIKYRTAGAVAFSDELNLIIYSFGLDSTAAVLSSTPLLTYRPATGYKFLPYTESSNAPSLRFGAVSVYLDVVCNCFKFLDLF